MRWGTERGILICFNNAVRKRKMGRKQRRKAAHMGLLGRCIMHRLWFHAVFWMSYWFWQWVILGGVRIQNNIIFCSVLLDVDLLIQLYIYSIFIIFNHFIDNVSFMTPAFKITWGVKVKYLMVILNYNFEQMKDGYFFGCSSGLHFHLHRKAVWIGFM